MGRGRRSAIVLLLTGVLLVTVGLNSSDAHVILDGEAVQAILLDVARYLKETKAGVAEEARLEALYLLGEKAQYLVELMNLDSMSHGKSLYAELIVKRLEEYGIRISFMERKRQYVYDLTAFHEYLKRSPRGKRAADIRFRLTSEGFYRSIGKDVAELVGIDLDGLRKAILQEEAFLKEYPTHEKVRQVRFFRAMDYYRLCKNSRDPTTAKKYEYIATQVLQEIVKDYPGTAEARAAESAIEGLQRASQKN